VTIVSSTTLSQAPRPAHPFFFAASEAVSRTARTIGMSIWNFLVAAGQARAAREMERLAYMVEATDPELAAKLRRRPV
jgi:hypothetical protein